MHWVVRRSSVPPSIVRLDFVYVLRKSSTTSGGVKYNFAVALVLIFGCDIAIRIFLGQELHVDVLTLIGLRHWLAEFGPCSCLRKPPLLAELVDNIVNPSATMPAAPTGGLAAASPIEWAAQWTADASAAWLKLRPTTGS